MLDTVSIDVGPGPLGPVTLPEYAAPIGVFVNLSLIS